MKQGESFRMEATEFVEATLNVATEEQGRLIWDNNRTLIDGAMIDALNHLQYRIETGEAPDIDIRFRFAPDPIYGDSGNVRNALDSLKRSQLVVPTDFTYRYYTFSPHPWRSAEELHDKLLAKYIGPIDIYRPLASRFVTMLYGVEVEPIPNLNPGGPRHALGPSPA